MAASGRDEHPPATVIDFLAARAFVSHEQEPSMIPSRIPGNEPDPGDMAVEPGIPVPPDEPNEPSVPDAEVGDVAPLP